MIREIKKWMCYSYFDRKPGFSWTTAHLFSPVKKKIAGMVCIPCPTMITDIKECDFVNTWSASTRTKINKAENDPLTLKRGKEILPEILHLFRSTASAKKLRGHHESDFQSRPWIVCSAVYSGEKMLAGHVWVLDEEEKRCLLFVNASAHHDKTIDASLVSRAHYYLLFQDGMFLRNNGIDCLDLHGYNPYVNDPALKGVYSWKEATHGKTEELYHYYAFWFYALFQLRKKMLS